MMITGTFFISFLIVFLSVKVGRSIGLESTETAPIEVSFLFSVSGVRYIYNHARHHLFETPLLPRRRFSSLSISWFSEILKRASFSSRNSGFVFTEDVFTTTTDKNRRNSSHIDPNNSRRASTSSKTKRLSVPHVHTNTNTNKIFTPSISQSIAIQSNSNDKLLSRRNTLPNIALYSEFLKIDHDTRILSGPESKAVSTTTHNDFENISTVPSISILNVILEEEVISEVTEAIQAEKYEIEPSKPNLMPIVEEDDEHESSFGEFITDSSDAITEGEELVAQDDEKSKNVYFSAESITIPQPSIQTHSNLESSSPKTSTSSFRSSYFNYLPESIFGYSTGMSKNLPGPISPPLETHIAPPGFSKRSASHDFTNSPPMSYSKEPSKEFNSHNHQPLYARRRTETSSSATKLFLPFDWSSIAEESNAPSRSNTSSPCLIDLQNTEDLFAPINWNFSGTIQNEELRRNWDSLEDDDTSKRNEIPKKLTSSRRQSTSFSSLFDGY